MRPVPPQLRHSWPRAVLPLPLHSGQMSSPVPGVPGGASSPGLTGRAGCGFRILPPAVLPSSP
jgi:hypothetical protein